MNTLLLPSLLGVMGMIAAFVVYMLVMKYPDGEDKVKKIGDQIHNGALAFMKSSQLLSRFHQIQQYLLLAYRLYSIQ